MKTEEKPATTPQVKKIYVMLRQKDMADIKEEFAKTFSNGRTEHISELYLYEARKLITALSDNNYAEVEYEKSKKIIKAIWHLGYTMDMLYGDTEDDFYMNVAKLNMFLEKRGTVKKDINKMTYQELKKVHRQFEKMAEKYKEKQNLNTI